MNIKNKWKKLFIIALLISFTGVFFDAREEIFEILSLIITVLIITALFKLIKGRKQTKSDTLPSMTGEKDQHYREAGMDTQQIKFFRETMNTARNQIQQLEKNMNTVAKLKAINLRNDTVKAAKAMFKELVKDPIKLHQADRFLYNHLPNLVDLTNKYIEINDHDLKSKNTYEALEKSAKVIDEVSKLLVSDYTSFVADDLEDLDIEIKIAEQNISREKSGHTTDTNSEFYDGEEF